MTDDEKQIKLADMAWAALWEEPERPSGSKLLWYIGGGVILAAIIAYIAL